MNQRIIIAIEDMPDEDRWQIEETIRQMKGVIRVHTEPAHYVTTFMGRPVSDLSEHKKFQSDAATLASIWHMLRIKYDGLLMHDLHLNVGDETIKTVDDCAYGIGEYLIKYGLDK